MLQTRKPLKRSTPLRARPVETRTDVIRPRRCKVCKCKYVHADLRVEWCSEEHGAELAMKRLEKIKAKQARLRVKVEKAAHRERKEKLKTRSDYIKEAQRAFNTYVRTRDAGKPCICCGRLVDKQFLTGSNWDCGHYRSVGSAPHLRFHLWNAHRQLVQCNQYGGGRAVDYRRGLIARIGLEKVEALEADQAPRKHDIEWLKRFIKVFRKKTRRLEKRRGK